MLADFRGTRGFPGKQVCRPNFRSNNTLRHETGFPGKNDVIAPTVVIGTADRTADSHQPISRLPRTIKHEPSTIPLLIVYFCHLRIFKPLLKFFLVRAAQASQTASSGLAEFTAPSDAMRLPSVSPAACGTAVLAWRCRFRHRRRRAWRKRLRHTGGTAVRTPANSPY